ncbi:hypothetical protein F5Y10DRAFT_241832, partial [Nemania abortiva]
MRLAILLLGTSRCALAAWLRWSVNRESVWAARETTLAGQADQVGWTPIPTPAPGLRKESQIALERLKRQAATSAFDLEAANPDTCGWSSGASSSPYVCQEGFTCSTNWKGVVACASGTSASFYTNCLDYSDYTAGVHTTDNGTGFCTDPSRPICGLYIWSGAPERYMYNCFERQTMIMLLDAPVSLTPTPISPPTLSSSAANSASTPVLSLPPMPNPSSTTTTASPLGNTTGYTLSYSAINSEQSPPTKSEYYFGPGARGSPSLSATSQERSTTTPSSTPSNDTRDNLSIKMPLIGTIIGVAIGALLLLPLLFFIGRKLILRRKNKRDTKNEDKLSITSQSSDGNIQGFWNLKPELDATQTRAELEGTPGEERGSGLYARKPELEGTPGIQGALGVYVRRKAELEACGRVAQSHTRSASASLSMLEYLLHPFTRPHIGPTELP